MISELITRVSTRGIERQRFDDDNLKKNDDNLKKNDNEIKSANLKRWADFNSSITKNIKDDIEGIIGKHRVPQVVPASRMYSRP